MINAPYFSIIIPTYNRAKVLPNAINSVLTQRFENWELLVVDDGSTDNTSAIVEEFKDERVRYIYQENAERSAARNNGIRNAKGKFICFLDSDDQFDENHLSGLHTCIKENNENDYLYVVHALAINASNGAREKLEIKIGSNDLETILLNSITPGQFVASLEALQRHKFNEKIRISEDTEILVRLMQDLELKFVNQYSLQYFLHEDNSVNTNRYNAFSDRKETLQTIFKYPICSRLSVDFKNNLLNNCYFGIYKYFKAQNRNIKAKSTMLEAILKYPRLRAKEKLYLFLKG